MIVPHSSSWYEIQYATTSLLTYTQIGHTSVDDPDATAILHDLQETLSTEPFKAIRDDIFALRAPPDGMPIYWWLRICALLHLRSSDAMQTVCWTLLCEALILHVKSVPERASKSKSPKCVFDLGCWVWLLISYWNRQFTRLVGS